MKCPPNERRKFRRFLDRQAREGEVCAHYEASAAGYVLERARISHGLLEGLSSLVQAAKARARGYRSTRNLIAMIYLTHGKLPLLQPI